MIGCLRTHARKQPIIALYFESETVLKLNNLEAMITEATKRNPDVFGNSLTIVFKLSPNDANVFYDNA